MQYLGEKSRIAQQIAEVINNEVSRWKVKNSTTDSVSSQERERESNRTFVSLFCGSCSVESEIKGFNKMICNDNHEYLIEMLKGVQGGYELPEQISEEEYKYIKEHKNEDKILAGFVGFGCSLGGKWFGGYARNKTGTNYALQFKKSLHKDLDNMENVEFTCLDYRDVVIPDGSIIYADPPCNNTTGYGKDKFNSEEFWEYMREISKKNKVFIKKFTRTLDINKDNQFKVTEKLFTDKN